MAKEALEDIILKSVEDASSCLVKGNKHKAHFLVNEDDAQEYLILLRNYYNMKDRNDAPVMRAFCREVHDYLMGITDTGGNKQVIVNGSSAFRGFQDYQEQEQPEVNLGNETFHSGKDNKFAEYIKNASLGTAIACTGVYAITQNPLALAIGIPALGIQAVSRIYGHFITKKNEKKKGELMALNAFLENTDFMLVKDVLDESKDKISAYIDKL
ncbi:MAG: hypothetical protein PHO02_00915 [Candidatus Nanoarchaeia archaeon]|nr:hypothetical protein [Candidatus Nanoarchaeia archaeon]